MWQNRQKQKAPSRSKEQKTHPPRQALGHGLRQFHPAGIPLLKCFRCGGSLLSHCSARAQGRACFLFPVASSLISLQCLTHCCPERQWAGFTARGTVAGSPGSHSLYLSAARGPLSSAPWWVCSLAQLHGGGSAPESCAFRAAWSLCTRIETFILRREGEENVL